MDITRLGFFCMVSVIVWQRTAAYEHDTSWLQTIRLKRQADSPCIVPLNPENGQYFVAGTPDAQPGQTLPVFQLTVSCNPGFRPKDRDVVFCLGGTWSAKAPECVRHCRLDPHPSVKYLCPASGNGFDDGFRNCKLYEPAGTVVKPQCNEPNYHYNGVKTVMRCTGDGRWDHVVFCTPDCGRVTPDGSTLILEGWTAQRGEIPWHAGIYLKPTGQSEEYKLICGGTIVSSRAIISAAHCFWSHGRVRPVTTVAVAVGKLFSKWNHPDDIQAQTFDVTDIKIPVLYRDYATNYQADIAAVTLSATIEFRANVRPVCVDLNPIFDRTQLRHGAIGKVAGWGYTDRAGTPSPILKVLDLPFVKIEQCIEEWPETFLQLVTNDKICAGYDNGSAVCRGDSGGGLVFPAMDRGVLRYYLRGIVSVAPRSNDECNAYTRASFTRIVEHSAFIEENAILIDAIISSPPDTFLLPAPAPPQSTISTPVRKPDPQNVEEECGTVVGGLPLILEGERYARGEWPWLVAIYAGSKGNLRYICAGTLVSNRHVVTVAHCKQVRQASTPIPDFLLKIGAHDLNDWTDSITVNRQLASATIHESYDSSTFTNNIMVMTMNRAVEFNKYVRPACLWSGLTDLDKIIGSSGVVAGWGSSSISESPEGPWEPRMVRVPVVSNNECRASRPEFHKLTNSKTFCAGDRNGTGPCLGDSGGGLYIRDGGRWRLRGVVSLSLRSESGTCNLNEYVIYVDSAKYINWLREVMSSS